MDLEIPRFLLAFLEKGAGVLDDLVQPAVEIQVDLLVPVAAGMAEDVGEGRPVGVGMDLAVGRDDEMVAPDDVQELVAGVVPASVVRDFHIVDHQRVLFRVSFHVPEVSLDVVGIAVAQHQDAQPVAAQDEADAGGVGELVRLLQVGRLDRLLGELFQRKHHFVQLHLLRLRHHLHPFLLLLLDHHAAHFRGRGHDLDGRERIFHVDAFFHVVPPLHLARPGQRGQQLRQLHALGDTSCRHVLHFHIAGAIGPYFLGGKLSLQDAGFDVLLQTADVVVVVVGQYQEVWRPGLLDLGHQHPAVPRRPAVNHDKAMLVPLVTFDDEGVTVLYR